MRSRVWVGILKDSPPLALTSTSGKNELSGDKVSDINNFDCGGSDETSNSWLHARWVDIMPITIKATNTMRHTHVDAGVVTWAATGAALVGMPSASLTCFAPEAPLANRRFSFQFLKNRPVTARMTVHMERSGWSWGSLRFCNQASARPITNLTNCRRCATFKLPNRRRICWLSWLTTCTGKRTGLPSNFISTKSIRESSEKPDIAAICIPPIERFWVAAVKV